MSLFSKSKCRGRRIKATRLKTSTRDRVTDRQERVPGFSQEALSKCTVTMIGAGGIGSANGYALARKGIGRLKIFDSDYVEASNLSRQFFQIKDIGKPKGERLAVNLARHSFTGSILEGYPYSFQDARALQIDLSCDIAICGVDNGETRVQVSKFYQSIGIPVIFIAVDLVGQCGYCFVQEPGKACFGCKFPNTLYSEKAPCRTPAVIDILLATGGLAVFAVDSLIMDRKRNWNYWEIHLGGFMDDTKISVKRIEDCPLCGESELWNSS